MVASLKNEFIEGFQDQNEDEELSVDHYLDKFQNSNQEATESEELEELEEPIEPEELESEEKEEPTEPEEIESEELEEDISNNPVVEGFNGSKKLELSNEKIWLKSILFGLLFYILSNPKIYDLTKDFTKQINKHVFHTIVFVIITYFLLLII